MCFGRPFHAKVGLMVIRMFPTIFSNFLDVCTESRQSRPRETNILYCEQGKGGSWLEISYRDRIFSRRGRCNLSFCQVYGIRANKHSEVNRITRISNKKGEMAPMADDASQVFSNYASDAIIPGGDQGLTQSTWVLNGHLCNLKPCIVRRESMHMSGLWLKSLFLWRFIAAESLPMNQRVFFFFAFDESHRDLYSLVHSQPNTELWASHFCHFRPGRSFIQDQERWTWASLSKVILFF